MALLLRNEFPDVDINKVVRVKQVHNNYIETITEKDVDEEFKQEVCWYIRFYNSERPHETNHYMTPEAFESQYYKKQQ